MKLKLQGVLYVVIVAMAIELVGYAQTDKPLSPATVKKIDTATKAYNDADKKATEAIKAVVGEGKTIPPVVSDAIKLRFFKAEFEFQQANEQATQATQVVREKQASLQGAVKELEKTCGEKYQPSLSKDRDPECVVKPEPPKAEPAKK